MCTIELTMLAVLAERRAISNCERRGNQALSRMDNHDLPGTEIVNHD